MTKEWRGKKDTINERSAWKGKQLEEGNRESRGEERRGQQWNEKKVRDVIDLKSVAAVVVEAASAMVV